MASGSNDNAGEPKFVPPALAEDPVGLPPGKYKLVAWEVVTTGRRLCDEICQIAAYFPPDSEYSQYIMPFGDLNPGARRRNNMRVVTIGRYRMLKDTLNEKVLKTKSEITGLSDFLNWLEANKSDDEKIILMYHEPRRLHPKVILQSMIRHNLLERFESIVAGFTDSYNLASVKCMNAIKSVALKILTTLLLDEDCQSVDTAMDRAKATYNVIDQLANQGGENLDVVAGIMSAEIPPSKEMMDLAIQFARPIHTELADLQSMQNLLERQNTFRPVMRPLLRHSTRAERRRLTYLRRILAEAGLLFYQFKDAWHEGRLAGLEQLMSPIEGTAKAEDIQELLDIFENHFDPLQTSRNQPSTSTAPAPESEEAVTEEFYFSTESDSTDPLPPSATDTVGSLPDAVEAV